MKIKLIILTLLTCCCTNTRERIEQTDNINLIEIPVSPGRYIECQELADQNNEDQEIFDACLRGEL